MHFETEEDIRKYVNGESYYKSLDNYCLGSTHEEAGEVLRMVLADARSAKEGSSK